MENITRAIGDAGSFLTRAVQDAHISDEASVIYSRAKQFTEEKLGKAERTELDPIFDDQAKRTDKVKAYTEKFVRDAEAVLVPNPAARLETFMFETIPVDKLGVMNNRLTNLEYLGTDMIEGGNEFGATTPYGTALIRVGQTEQALGQIERDYIRHAHDAMIGPLKRFLEGEMKNIAKERKILENKRLDLDSCKNKVRKARALQLQPVKEGVDPRTLLDQAEAELRSTQSDYDKQVEVTKMMMDGLKAIQTNHLRHLNSFVESQAKFYANCHQIMQDLQRELSSTTAMSEGQLATPTLRPGVVSASDIGRGTTAMNPAPYGGQLHFNQGGVPRENGGGGGGGDHEDGAMAAVHQVNLSSPPPAFPRSAMQSADFF